MLNSVDPWRDGGWWGSKTTKSSQETTVGTDSVSERDYFCLGYECLSSENHRTIFSSRFSSFTSDSESELRSAELRGHRRTNAVMHWDEPKLTGVNSRFNEKNNVCLGFDSKVQINSHWFSSHYEVHRKEGESISQRFGKWLQLCKLPKMLAGSEKESRMF